MKVIDRRRGQYVLIGVLSLWLLACTGVPEGVDPVTGFDQNRYLGTWYEIARLDHSFEHGLSEVSATYDVNPDGSIAVLNRGFDQEEGEWREAEGVARFVQSPDIAHLKVSFFGPSMAATWSLNWVRTTTTPLSRVSTAVIYGFSRERPRSAKRYERSFYSA